MSKGKTPLGPTGVVMDFTLIHVYNSSHNWKKGQLLAGERVKRRLYTQSYGDFGWVFLAFVTTTVGQLALELLRYLLLCAGQAAQRASVAAGDASTPVDEDGEEPAEARSPTFPQLRELIFQQLKSAILVEVLEAVAGVSIWAFDRTSGFSCFSRRTALPAILPSLGGAGVWVLGLPLGLGGRLVWLL